MALGLRSTPTNRSAGKRCARGSTRLPLPHPKSTTTVPGSGSAADSSEAKFSTCARFRWLRTLTVIFMVACDVVSTPLPTRMFVPRNVVLCGSQGSGREPQSISTRRSGESMACASEINSAPSSSSGRAFKRCSASSMSLRCVGDIFRRAAMRQPVARGRPLLLRSQRPPWPPNTEAADRTPGCSATSAIPGAAGSTTRHASSPAAGLHRRKTCPVVIEIQHKRGTLPKKEESFAPPVR